MQKWVNYLETVRFCHNAVYTSVIVVLQIIRVVWCRCSRSWAWVNEKTRQLSIWNTAASRCI